MEMVGAAHIDPNATLPAGAHVSSDKDIHETQDELLRRNIWI